MDKFVLIISKYVSIFHFRRSDSKHKILIKNQSVYDWKLMWLLCKHNNENKWIGFHRITQNISCYFYRQKPLLSIFVCVCFADIYFVVHCKRAIIFTVLWIDRKLPKTFVCTKFQYFISFRTVWLEFGCKLDTFFT